MSDLDRIKLRDVAWNFIANNDESANFIPDGEIDMGAEFLADFFEHAEAKRMEFDTGDSGLHLQRVMHRKSFLEERITYTENKLKQDRNSEEVDSLEYDLYGFKQQLAAIEYVLYGA